MKPDSKAPLGTMRVELIYTAPKADVLPLDDVPEFTRIKQIGYNRTRTGSL